MYQEHQIVLYKNKKATIVHIHKDRWAYEIEQNNEIITVTCKDITTTVLCPYCEKDYVGFSPKNPEDSYSSDHYICGHCDSTYTDLEDVEWYRKKKEFLK